MREQSKILKSAVATIFLSINESNVKQGINRQFKYISVPIKEEVEKVDGKETKTPKTVGWKFDIVMSELGYPDITIQSFPFQKPANIDKFTMEYHVFLHALSAIIDTGLNTWVELGKKLNLDKELQKEAIQSTKENGKKDNKNTNKRK